MLYYKVAQHTFAITAPDNCDEAVVAFLSSYIPFRLIKLEDGEKLLFTLHLLNSAPDYDLPEYTGFDWDESHCYVKRDEEHYAFEVQPNDSDRRYVLLCDTDFNEGHVQFEVNSPDTAYILGNFIMMMYAFAAANKDTLLMHASVIEKDGRGYLFQGKSGTGKSTHSLMWLQNVDGVTLLNDDNPVVRIINDEVRVFGSPWSGKTPCYRNDDATVGGFVRIIRAPQNSIRQYDQVEAFASVYPSCSTMKWDKQINGGISSTLTRIVTLSPCYAMSCLPNAEAAIVCSQTIIKK